MERRLAAIMFVDIVGYTALMAASEAKGLRARERHRAVVRPLVEKHGGEAIEARGDESLAVFPTALDAVNCALAIEEALAGDGELRLHIGIHLGDFVVERGEVSGDAVNIAARIRSFAESGVCVSGEVYHSVRNQPNVEASPLGEHELKNVGRSLTLFAIRGAPAAPSTTARPAAGGRGPIRSLAVLPLENLSGDPSQEYFADGMTETLIADLGNLRALRVISRTSVMQYKSAVARKIELELSPSEAKRLADHPPVDPAAHDAFLRGLYQIGRQTPRGLRSSIGSFQRAIELDPRSARAHAWLGQAWFGLTNDFFAVPAIEGMPKARSAGLRALDLDDQLAEAHCVLGFVAMHFDWDWTGSKRHFELALELNPSLELAHLGYCCHLSSRRRHEDAIAEVRQAVELSPFNLTLRTDLAHYHRHARRYGDALDHVRSVIALDPNFQFAHWVAAGIYGALGRYEEQIGAYEHAGGVASEAAAALRATLSREGAQGYFRELLGVVRSQPWGQRPLILAQHHAQLGQRDEAFAELERAYASRDGRLAYLRVDVTYDPIRDDPRFDALVRRIGIPDS